MRFKTIIVPAALLVIGATAYTLTADPLGWSDKPNFEYWSTDFDKRVELHVAAWKDGSAEAWVRPLYELPPEQLPNTGRILIDDHAYKFAPRVDRDGKWGFFCSIPVEGIPLNGSFVFDLIIHDSTGFQLLHEHTEPTLNWD